MGVVAINGIEFLLALLFFFGVFFGLIFLGCWLAEGNSRLDKEIKLRNNKKNNIVEDAVQKVKQQQSTKIEENNTENEDSKQKDAQKEKRDDLSKENWDEIDREIDEVFKYVGVSEYADNIELTTLFDSGKKENVIGIIARRMSLPMKVNANYISETKYHDGGGIHLAEVRVGNIPHYGSKNLDFHPCTINYYLGSYDSGADRFISTTAHELCHYILQSLRPRETNAKKEERMTDIAVIFEGFWTSLENDSRKNSDGGTGYLSEEEKYHVYEKYKTYLYNRRALYEKIKEDYSNILKEQADSILFVELCSRLYEHPGEKIEKEDQDAINHCLALASYSEVKKIKSIMNSFEKFTRDRLRYDANMDKERENRNKLKELLNNISFPATGEIAVLMKYVDKYK